MTDTSRAEARAQELLDVKLRKIKRLEERLAKERQVCRGTETEIAQEKVVADYLAAHPLLAEPRLPEATA